MSKPETKEDKYEFTEEELVELLQIVREWRKKLFKHPESSDHVALLQLEQHLVRRLEQIAIKRYFKEKGLEHGMG
jgi:hypothetical protein